MALAAARHIGWLGVSSPVGKTSCDEGSINRADGCVLATWKGERLFLAQVLQTLTISQTITDRQINHLNTSEGNGSARARGCSSIGFNAELKIRAWGCGAGLTGPALLAAACSAT